MKKKMSEIGNEIGKDEVRKEEEEEKTKIVKKESHKELSPLRRMTKMQVQEVLNLFEEGKTLDEVSKHFETRYKCKPLSKERLRKHLTNFYKLKERVKNNKTHHPQPPVSIITNQDIGELKEKMFSLPTNNLSNSVETYKIVSKERDDSLSGIPLKFLLLVLVAILILLVILGRRRVKEKKEPEPKPKSFEERLKRRGLKVKWV